jgi:hypothetical protein
MIIPDRLVGLTNRRQSRHRQVEAYNVPTSGRSVPSVVIWQATDVLNEGLDAMRRLCRWFGRCRLHAEIVRRLEQGNGSLTRRTARHRPRRARWSLRV